MITIKPYSITSLTTRVKVFHSEPTLVSFFLIFNLPKAINTKFAWHFLLQHLGKFHYVYGFIVVQGQTLPILAPHRLIGGNRKLVAIANITKHTKIPKHIPNHNPSPPVHIHDHIYPCPPLAWGRQLKYASLFWWGRVKLENNKVLSTIC